MTRLILFLMVTQYITFGAFSQTTPTYKTYKKEREEESKIAQENILLMKEGVLLIRLDFKSKEVEYYQKYNNSKAADKILKQQTELNHYIIEAIDSLFTFCPVYYFAEKDSRNVLEGKMDQVVFYNTSCEPDTSIKWKNESFFIGEFGKVEGDTTLEESSKFSLAAFIIRSPDFKQLRDPFPYFSMYHEWGIKRKKYRMPARKMSAALDVYYKKVKAISAEK